MDTFKDISDSENYLHVLEMSRMVTINGPGIRTMVHFKGCNLDCRWCSTPESKSFRQQLAFSSQNCICCRQCVSICPAGAISFSMQKGISVRRQLCTECFQCAETCCTRSLSVLGERYTAEGLFDLLIRDINLYQRSGGGVTFSGGEVLLHINYEMMRLLDMLKEAGISVGFDTAGCVEKKILDQVIPYADFFLWDVKILDTEDHKKYCGIGNERILENLRYVDSQKVPVYLRCPVIPGVNDSDAHFSGIENLVSSLHMIKEIHLLPFHKLGGARYERIGLENPFEKMNDLPEGYIQEKQKKLKEHGYRVKIIG